MRWRSILIDERGAGKRADVYLAARFSMYSRAAFAQAIREGQVLRDVHPLKPSSPLRTGDVLRIGLEGLAPSTGAPPLPPILHEDERLIALDKPAGMLVHPAGEAFAWGLIGLVKRARPKHRVDLVHRLDRETSGALIFTKDLEANVALKKVFFEHRVRKVYHAIARGVIPWDEQDIEAPIGDAEAEVKLRRGVRPDGQAARTKVTVLQRLAAHTLVSCRIFTGRTHQIRVHMEHAGYPLLGDKLYGQPDAVFLHHLERGVSPWLREQIGFPRHALHAALVSFPHPDGQLVTIRAPLPADLQAIVDGAAPEWPAE